MNIGDDYLENVISSICEEKQFKIHRYIYCIVSCKCVMCFFDENFIFKLNVHNVFQYKQKYFIVVDKHEQSFRYP